MLSYMLHPQLSVGCQRVQYTWGELTQPPNLIKPFMSDTRRMTQSLILDFKE